MVVAIPSACRTTRLSQDLNLNCTTHGQISVVQTHKRPRRMTETVAASGEQKVALSLCNLQLGATCGDRPSFGKAPCPFARSRN